MRKLVVIFLMLCMVALAACSEDSSSEEPQKDETTKEEVAETDETEEESPDDAGSQALGDAEQILKKSAEAMAGITSFLAEGKISEDTTTNGINDRVETTLSVEMVLGDSPQMYTRSNTTSNIDGNEETEMYFVEEMMYMKSEGQWFSMTMNQDNGQTFEMFKGLDGERLDEYLQQSQWFEVTDNGDHYLLSFKGDENQYKSVVMGATEEVIGETLKEHFDNMKVSGTYEMKIDKDTFHMTEYATEYEATTSGEMGEVETKHRSTYTISNVNEYEEIKVPEEAVEQAQSFQ